MKIQYGRRHRSRMSRSDRATLITTLAGLVLVTLSWAYFHAHFLQGVPGPEHEAAYERSSARGRRFRGVGGQPGSPTAAAASGGGAVEEAARRRFCEAHFGMDWVRAWNATRRQVCSPRDGAEQASSITCGSPDPDDHLPAAGAPHVFCDATNLWLDPSKLQRARCPQYRPRYLCMTRTYHRYAEGAWAAACDWPGLQFQEYFSKDHMQDIFGAMLLGAAAVPPPSEAVVEELPTLIVTREVNEHANVYHTLTDLLNVYISLQLLGWHNSPRQVLILDAHRNVSLDLLWPVVAAGGGGTALSALGEEGDPWQLRLRGRLLARRVADLKGPMLFRHAAFVPPGYASLLFAHLYEDGSCRQPTELFRGFRRFMLAPFGLGGGPAAAGPLRVRLVSRKPSKARRKMARQIANEEELLEALQQAAAAAAGSGGGSNQAQQLVEVSMLDLSELTLPQQLEVVTGTDVLIAMHGAALAYAILMQPHAAVVELWPQKDGIWRCYEHFSEWGGLLYRRLANSDPAKHVQTARGDKTTVDAAALRAAVEELLPAVRSRKAEAAAASGGGGAFRS